MPTAPTPTRPLQRLASTGRPSCGPVWSLALLVAGLGAWGGCARETPRTPWLDLTAALSLAEIEPIAGGRAEEARPQKGQAPEVQAAGDALYLPFGARVSYYSVPPPDTALIFDAVEPRGGVPGWVRVSSTLEGEAAVRRTQLSPSGAGSVEIPSDGERTVRLTLEAVPSQDGGSAAGGLILRRPVLAAPTPPHSPPTQGRVEAPPSPPRRLNVIVYLIDTLRADHLGCYGYPRAVSPAIDAFAAASTLFENAVAQSSWTRPSVVSLFTGLWPGTHGVHGRRDRLAPEALTLAEILHQHGWRTAGFVTNRNVARAFGLAQGFESYRMLRQDNSSEEVHREAAQWIGDWRAQGAKAPFFVYLHTVEPHSAYQPPEPFRSRFAPDVPDDGTGTRWWLKRLKRGEIPASSEILGHLRDLYDAEIAANDASFGRLVELLEETGLWDETVVVLLSDHGEEFREHGRWEHGKSLHTEVLDVPLILHLPGQVGKPFRGLRVTAPVQHIDLLPTLLSVLGLPIPEAVEGRDLLPLLEGGEDVAGSGGDIAQPPEVYSYLDLDGFEAAAVTTPAWRLIDGRSELHGLGSQLYDRREDPRELTDLTAERPVTAGYLEACLRARELDLGQALTAGEAILDDETREQLRALGYLD